MPLSAGDKLGHYEVLSLLGQGGMGEVYRARDTTLKRDVALKVVPEAFLRDTERMARFQREAEVLASLDHPHIGPIYGLVDSGESRALVLGLIEGPTLADRIEAGPIPADEAIAISKQIIEALEYAHDRGVIHRDLKPANIKITLDGVVKVLDFGLAKVLEDEPPPSSLANSPTLTLGHTRAGMILGTAAYMSPEQAVGRPVDRRSDIFSFGAVFYEMLTGQRAFGGNTTPDVLEAVVKTDPDWSKLPTGPVRNLLRRCLTKDRKQRLQSIGEARIALEHPGWGELQLAAGLQPRVSKLPWALVAAATLSLAALAFLHFRETPPVEKSIRFQIAAPAKDPIGAFRLSPDGRYLAFIAGAKLWIRPLDSLEAKSLDGTEGAVYPFWSPDSDNVGFFSQGKLKRIPRTGGPVQTLCEATTSRGGTWNRDGVILFSPGPTATLFRVSAAGGTPVAVTKFAGTSPDQGHRFPEFLPDGQHFLYNAQRDRPEDSGLYMGDLDGTGTRLLPELSSAIFAPPRPGEKNGHLLFRRGDTLMAQPFDLARLQLAGDVFPVSERVGQAANTNTGFGAFSISDDGTLVTGSGETGNRQLIWMDRAGKRLSTVSEPANLIGVFAFAPDGRKIAYVIGNNEESTIWLLDSTGGSPSRFTFAPGRNAAPVWSPDGASIVFTLQGRSAYSSDLILKPANGAGKEELLIHAGVNGQATDWSRDGRFLAYRADQPSADLWLLPMAGERKPVSFLRTPYSELAGHFSPDGKFLVYTSDESGQQQVYVQPVPPNGSKWQVSKAGGQNPIWRRDGKEIFYSTTDQKIMAVTVKTEPAFEAGTPQMLMEGVAASFAPSADGQRFLVSVRADGEAAQVPALTVITHWRR